MCNFDWHRIKKEMGLSTTVKWWRQQMFLRALVDRRSQPVGSIEPFDREGGLFGGQLSLSFLPLLRCIPSLLQRICFPHIPTSSLLSVLLLPLTSSSSSFLLPSPPSSPFHRAAVQVPQCAERLGASAAVLRLPGALPQSTPSVLVHSLPLLLLRLHSPYRPPPPALLLYPASEVRGAGYAGGGSLVLMLSGWEQVLDSSPNSAAWMFPPELDVADICLHLRAP
eukprot:146529-Hanusia_phi.AAC.2